MIATPGLVVAAEHRRAVAADDVAVDDGRDAVAGLDGVHVRAEEERRRRRAVPGTCAIRLPDLAAAPRVPASSKRDRRRRASRSSRARRSAMRPSRRERLSIWTSSRKSALQPVGVDHAATTRAGTRRHGRRRSTRRLSLPCARHVSCARMAARASAILVAGAGALGSVVGGLLARAGLAGDAARPPRRTWTRSRATGSSSTGSSATHRVTRARLRDRRARARAAASTPSCSR